MIDKKKMLESSKNEKEKENGIELTTFPVNFTLREANTNI